MTLYNVIMPKLSLTMMEGIIVEWYKSPGQSIEKDELLLEVTTDKVNMTVESPYSGVLKEILAEEGDAVEVMKPLAIIEGQEGQQDFSTQGNESQEQVKEETPCQTIREEQFGERVFASPAARSFARDKGIDLNTVKGSGPDGRIVLDDVTRVSRQKPKLTPVAKIISEENKLDLTSLAAEERLSKKDVQKMINRTPLSVKTEKISGIKRAMANRMIESWTKIPHVTLNMEVEMSDAVKLKAAIEKEFQNKISYTVLIVKAASFALLDYPLLNATYQDGEIHYNDRTNIGIATDAPSGLFVPVVKDAHLKDILTISKEIKEGTKKALHGELTTEEMTGGTFTVSNLGMFGIDSFTPIINPPEAAILGVNRLRQLKADFGREQTCYMLTLSLSFDHRFIDGATGAKFLNRIKFLLEKPFFFDLKA